jgi:hypothetical protein
MILRSPTDNENGGIFDRLSPLSNPSTSLRAGSFPVEGKGFDPILPSMGRIEEGEAP